MRNFFLVSTRNDGHGVVRNITHISVLRLPDDSGSLEQRPESGGTEPSGVEQSKQALQRRRGEAELRGVYLCLDGRVRHIR